MTTHFDEKGKFFTPIVTKEPVSVIIQTIQHRITGCIHIRLEERIKDELDRNELFLAVTDAKIFDAGGQEISSAAFITINRQHIIWVIPVSETEKTE